MEEELLTIINDLEKIKNSDRDAVYARNVEKRLDFALMSYIKQLDEAEHFAQKKEMKRLNERTNKYGRKATNK